MRDSASDAPTLEFAWCPDCGHERLTAGPFSKSGPLEGRSTTLDVTQAVDERGYIVCARCGLVQNDEAAIFGNKYDDGIVDALRPGIARSAVGASTYNNHYDRLIRQHTTYDMSRGDLRARLAVPRKTRDRVTFVAGVLYDADALCSAYDIRDDLKKTVLHAVEAFFSDHTQRRAPVRYEAFVCAILAAVLQRRAPKRLASMSRSGSVPFWSAFGVNATTQQRATERVESWFTTYWK